MVDVSRETKLDDYLALLERWGRTVNLTSAASSLAAGRHVEDSLSLLPHLPDCLDRLIDLGSGQGFPAIPIAIYTGIRVDLIESDRRKSAFLTTVLAHLRLSGAVWPTRIEATAIPPARCVTARALAPLPRLIQLARPFVGRGGICLFLKGRNAAAELADARRQMALSAEIIDGPDPTSRLVKITELG